MIDHISIAVRDLAASAAAYEKILAPLGLKRVVAREGSVGFGKNYPEFWLNARPAGPASPANPGAHVALRAPDEAAVSAFHAAALKAGCTNAEAAAPTGQSRQMVEHYSRQVVGAA